MISHPHQETFSSWQPLKKKNSFFFQWNLTEYSNHTWAGSASDSKWPTHMNWISFLSIYFFFKSCLSFAYISWFLIFVFVWVLCMCVSMYVLLMPFLCLFSKERERKHGIECIGRWGGFVRRCRRGSLIRIYCLKKLFSIKDE